MDIQRAVDVAIIITIIIISIFIQIAAVAATIVIVVAVARPIHTYVECRNVCILCIVVYTIDTS